MGPILFDDSRAWRSGRRAAFQTGAEPTDAARGVLFGLAISSVFWIALALALPLVW
jgi:hypothetical protein